VELNSLREQAMRCRRLAHEIDDRQVVKALKQMADECDTLIASLERDRAPAGDQADPQFGRRSAPPDLP
jgi:hypothetical protein